MISKQSLLNLLGKSIRSHRLKLQLSQEALAYENGLHKS